jgi:hypothetical protein
MMAPIAFPKSLLVAVTDMLARCSDAVIRPYLYEELIGSPSSELLPLLLYGCG